MHLKCIQNGFTVTQETVRYLLNDLDPEGVAIRKRKILRRCQYHNKGPNYLWHTVCYDKLNPYGIPISGCIDGFSHYILSLEAAPTCNDPRVISVFFFNAVSTLKGWPTSLRTDTGTENRHIEQIQTFFHRNNHSNNRLFLYRTSPANQKIELGGSADGIFGIPVFSNFFGKRFRDEREDEAYKFMKKAAHEISAKNEFCTFGTFVADNVRKLKSINQILAKFQITNMLMDLQIKEMETCERQRLITESSDTTTGTFNSDTQSFAIDESSNLALNTVHHLTSHDNINDSFRIGEYLSNNDNNDI
ncbi:hypothetical protein QTP88_027977 [Uroleucon formosanum]